MNGSSYAHVFRPGRIGSLELPHRVVMGSMHLGMESEPDGHGLAAFYVERARGGAALMITGGSAVSRVGAGGRHYSFINEPDEHPKLEYLARAVHEAGGRIALQLFHAGRYASERFFGLQPLAPSAVASRFSAASPPRAMSPEELTGTIEDFAQGAKQARALGFDAVEIMGSEGYLLNQFLSPLTNRRDDPWGGDFERRTRFPLAVLHAVRNAVGPGFAVIYRTSATDLMPEGTRDEEAVRFARLLALEGADALDIGVGWHESSTPTVQLTVSPGAWVSHAERIADAAAPIPVIASTRINSLELAEQVLARGKAAFVALARPFLADPNLIEKGRTGRAESINACIACNQACIDRSLRDQRVSCMVNPAAGAELALRREPRPVGPHRAYAVVGGGPAGLEAARVLGTLGHHVALFEAQARLGGQFHLASEIPGKADYARTIGYFQGELNRLGVEVHLSHRIDEDSVDQLDRYAGVIVTSGVVPKRIDLPGVNLPLVRYYQDALLAAAQEPVRAAREHPIAIIGAGGIGVDLAHLYSTRGHPVTLMCRGGTIGSRIGRSTRWVLLKELRHRGVQLLTGVSYERIVAAGVWIRMPDGPRRLLEAQTVIIAAGQASHDALSHALDQRSRPFRTAGGARTADTLDAVRAFAEGAQAARALANSGQP